MDWGADVLHGYLSLIHISILHESEESSDTMKVCTTYQEIMETVEAGKIACILGIEGGRPLEGKSNYDSLDILEIFYKLGLRQVQLCDFGRNRLGDGLSTAETHGGLTPFGKNIIRRMNQLGMIVDTAHMNDEGFWDTVKAVSYTHLREKRSLLFGIRSEIQGRRRQCGDGHCGSGHPQLLRLFR